MSLTITVSIDPVEAQRSILEGMVEYLGPVLQAALAGSKLIVSAIAEKSVVESPEAKAIIDGDLLQGELGVVHPQEKLNAIAAALSLGIRATYQTVRVVGSNIQGGFTIEILREDLAELRDVMERVAFTSENGHWVDWLKWLLFEGDDVVIADYHFVATTNNPRSRTGLGLMRKGGTWHVPEDASGTVSDNFITRALDGIGDDVAEAIIKEVERRIA